MRMRMLLRIRRYNCRRVLCSRSRIRYAGMTPGTAWGVLRWSVSALIVSSPLSPLPFKKRCFVEVVVCAIGSRSQQESLRTTSSSTPLPTSIDPIFVAVVVAVTPYFVCVSGDSNSVRSSPYPYPLSPTLKVRCLAPNRTPFLSIPSGAAPSLDSTKTTNSSGVQLFASRVSPPDFLRRKLAKEALPNAFISKESRQSPPTTGQR